MAQNTMWMSLFQKPFLIFFWLWKTYSILKMCTIHKATKETEITIISLYLTPQDKKIDNLLVYVLKLYCFKAHKLGTF